MMRFISQHIAIKNIYISRYPSLIEKVKILATLAAYEVKKYVGLIMIIILSLSIGIPYPQQC